MNKRLYRIFNNAKQRCYNPNNPDFIRYGGKGIDICDYWLKSFKEFETWALANEYTDDMTIDRIEATKGYSPDNCQWLTKKQNSAKKRVKYVKNRPTFEDTEAWRSKRLVIDRRKPKPKTIKTRTTGTLNYGTKNIYISKETAEQLEYLMVKLDKTISRVIKISINEMYGNMKQED